MFFAEDVYICHQLSGLYRINKVFFFWQGMLKRRSLFNLIFITVHSRDIGYGNENSQESQLKFFVYILTFLNNSTSTLGRLRSRKQNFPFESINNVWAFFSHGYLASSHAPVTVPSRPWTCTGITDGKAGTSLFFSFVFCSSGVNMMNEGIIGYMFFVVYVGTM